MSTSAVSIKSININYSVNNLTVNGNNTGKGKEVFISEGKTYIPISVISEILGYDVTWDPDTKTIAMNLKQATDTSVSVNPNDPMDLPLANTSTNNTISNTSNTSSNKYITLEQAKNEAIKAVGGGNIIYSKYDLYDRTPNYDFKVMNNGRLYEVEVDAITGAIIDFEIDD